VSGAEAEGFFFYHHTEQYAYHKTTHQKGPEAAEVQKQIAGAFDVLEHASQQAGVFAVALQARRVPEGFYHNPEETELGFA
jgi:hypothetical protein